jgi:N-hydroxyarylamine O-acetyltransferase
MNTNAYLKRIGYCGSLDVTPETLRQLQLAHLRAVPFENLSIHSSEPIVLSEHALFEKIVTRRRGGFCYELNGLFASLLRDLGFKVEMLSAAVMGRDGEFGPEFDHMTLLVTMDKRWLVDVGFGDSFIEPLRLDEREEQLQGTRAYRMVEEKEHFAMLQKVGSGEWRAQYRFTLTPHQFVDYEDMCHFHQTSPLSHFTQGKICSKLTEDGRLTISEMKLITTRGEEREESELSGQDEYNAVLLEKFGIRSPLVK